MAWSEDEAKRAAAWQEFRAGRELARASAAEGVTVKDGLASGSFREGRKALRTVVKREGGMLMATCGCAENRATGAFCRHAVALVIEAEKRLARAAKAGVPEVSTRQAAAGTSLGVAIRGVFLGPLEKVIGEGRAVLRFEEAEEEPGPEDQALGAWLAGRGITSLPARVTVGGEDFESLLQAVEGHSRLTDERGQAVRLPDEPARMALLDSVRNGGAVEFSTDRGQAGIWFAAGESLGRLVKRNDGWQLQRAAGNPRRAGGAAAGTLSKAGRVRLPLEDVLAELDAWLDLFESPAPGWLDRLKFRAAEPELRIELEGSFQAIDGRAIIGYPGGGEAPLDERTGEREVSGLPSLGEGDEVWVRNREREERWLTALRKAGLAPGAEPGSLRARDHEAIVGFLANDLPHWEKTATVRIGPRLRHQLQSLHVIRPEIALGGPQALTLELSFQTGSGKEVPLAKVREILRSGRGAVKTSNGAVVTVAREVSDTLEPLLADLGMVRPEGKIHLDRARAILFRKFRKNESEEFEANEFEGDAITAPLRPYQRTGCRWIVHRLEELGGALLGDEMGLGKTVQTITAMRTLRQRDRLGRVLLVVPTSLIGNWQDEIGRWGSELKVVTLHGSGRDEKRGAAEKADVVITSYGTLSRDLAYHLRQRYRLMVVDEASLLRNPDSEVSRAVAKLEVERRLALSGTPIENRPLDLWSIFRVIAPGYLGPKKDFLERYEAKDATAATLERLRLRASPFVLRRTKEEVAPDLPEKLEVDEWLDLGSSERGLYEAIARAGLQEFEALMEKKQQGAGRLHLLTVLLRLRQCCLDPVLVDAAQAALDGAKAWRLRELLKERAEISGKTLVFSQFREFLRRMSQDERGSFGELLVLDGATRNRGELVKRFQQVSGPAVFFISLKAGGYGLNLTAADAVVHMDPWWNPAAEAQASDRAHRIGQTKPVTVHRLLIRNSVEERVRQLQAKKRAVITGLQGEAEMPTNWSMDDLRSLIS